MISYQVHRQCERHNRDVCRVAKYGRFPIDRILYGEGDLLLTGGSFSERQNILRRLVCRLRRQFPEMPLFFFTASAEMERLLIGDAKAGLLGQLRVISPDYPNYDVFCGMAPAVIAGILAKAAGGDEELYGYALAFLSVLEQAGTLCLSDMMDFARNADAAIAAWAQDHGLPEAQAQITGLSQGGMRFRSALQTVSAAFSNLTHEDCATRFSLGNAIHTPGAVCLRAGTARPEVLAVYFSCALQTLLGQGCRFCVVLDEPVFLRSPAFGEALAALKQSPLVTAAVSVENAAAFEGEEFLANFGRAVILPDGGRIGPPDLQKILDSLGSYPHFEPARTVSGPPRLLGLRPVGDNILTYSRPKVLAGEAEGFQAVLSGHRGTEIGLVRRLEV